MRQIMLRWGTRRLGSSNSPRASSQLAVKKFRLSQLLQGSCTDSSSRLVGSDHTRLTRTCPARPGSSDWSRSTAVWVGLRVSKGGCCSLSRITATPRALKGLSPSCPLTCKVKYSPFSRVVSLSSCTETVFSCSPGAKVRLAAWAM